MGLVGKARFVYGLRISRRITLKKAMPTQQKAKCNLHERTQTVGTDAIQNLVCVLHPATKTCTEMRWHLDQPSRAITIVTPIGGKGRRPRRESRAETRATLLDRTGLIPFPRGDSI